MLKEAEILMFRDHTPYYQFVDAEAIVNGRYVRLNGLQGRHNMFYTGGTFDTQASSLLWDFTEKRVLPQLPAML